MTCCPGPTSCVGCEVDGIPLAGADWIDDSWMRSIVGVPPRQALPRRTRMPAAMRVRGEVAPAPAVHIGRDGKRTVRRRGNPPAHRDDMVALAFRGNSGISDRYHSRKGKR